jgi:glycogen operon protein
VPNVLTTDTSTGINFLAAHDGFSLRDLVTFENRHNHANGEENRDGHGENHSWNCGVEGATEDEVVNSKRERDIRALLTTLFFSLGTPMLMAGDEFGRTQHGNNNAYAQDNEATWLDWGSANLALADLVGSLARLRSSLEKDLFSSFLRTSAEEDGNGAVGSWFGVEGRSLEREHWTDAQTLGLMIGTSSLGPRYCFLFNRTDQSIVHGLPAGKKWRPVFCSCEEDVGDVPLGKFLLPARSVTAFVSIGD